jgi:hypothetical protein
MRAILSHNHQIMLIEKLVSIIDNTNETHESVLAKARLFWNNIFWQWQAQAGIKAVASRDKNAANYW